MPEKFEKDYDSEMEQNLEPVIQEAMTNAPTIEEVQEKENELNNILQKFIKGEYSLREFLEKDKEIIIHGRVEILDFDVLKKTIFKITKDQDIASELSFHEREHANELIKAGFRFKIYLVFDRDKNNEIGFHAQIEPELSENMDVRAFGKYLQFMEKH